MPPLFSLRPLRLGAMRFFRIDSPLLFLQGKRDIVGAGSPKVECRAGWPSGSAITDLLHCDRHRGAGPACDADVERRLVARRDAGWDDDGHLVHSDRAFLEPAGIYFRGDAANV